MAAISPCTLTLVAILLAPCLALSASDYRTDADGGDSKLPWFRLQHGEFPPENTAHEIGGELISLDHINRSGVLRQDRTDAIRRSEWDRPLPFTMLAYGSIRYHGAPAELKDIPLGTHLHGQFYLEEKATKDGKGAFDRVLLLEDDFSYCLRKQRTWRVESMDTATGAFTVMGLDSKGQPADPKPSAFQITPATRVWKGHGIGALTDLARGQTPLINLTVCTLKGPGRCTDLWIDEESRKVASVQQVEVHRVFEHEHGLPAWIDEVDNHEGIVTATIFAGFDPKLEEDFTANDSIAAAVAEESLRTYDQVSDRMKGDLLEVQHVPAGPGCSGFRLKFKPTTLLEGFRPKRIIRIFSGKWGKVDDIPKEERLYQ